MIFLLQVNVEVSYMFTYVLFTQTVFLYIQNELIIAFKNFKIAESFNKI